MSDKETTEPQPLVLAQTPWIRLGGYSPTAPTGTTKNYFTSSDPHHDISKQLVDTTFV